MEKVNDLSDNPSYDLASRRFEWKLQIEAALFISPQPISIVDIHNQLDDIPQSILAELLHELIRDYKGFQGAIEIHHFPNDTYQMLVCHDVIIEPEIIPFTSGAEFTPAELQVLAFIAFNQPITQEDIFEFLGSKCKKVIIKLESKGYLVKDAVSQTGDMPDQSNNPSESLPYRTSPLFADYMGIRDDMDTIKNTIQSYYESLKQKAEAPKVQKKIKFQEMIPRESKPDRLFEIVSEADFKAAVANFDKTY
jgi:chromosome segregation and condensation protein ScpB